VPVSGDAAAVRSFIIAAAVVTAHPYRSFRRCRLVSPPTSDVDAAVRRQQHQQQQQQQQRVRHRRPLSLPLTPPRSQWSVAPPSARSPRTAVAVAVVVAVFVVVVVVVPIAAVFVVVVVAVIAAPPSFSTAVAVAVAAFALSNGGRTSPRSQSYYHSGTSAAAIINRLVETRDSRNISTATTGTASTTTASTTSTAATSVASATASGCCSRTTAAILLL